MTNIKAYSLLIKAINSLSEQFLISNAAILINCVSLRYQIIQNDCSYNLKLKSLSS